MAAMGDRVKRGAAEGFYVNHTDLPIDAKHAAIAKSKKQLQDVIAENPGMSEREAALELGRQQLKLMTKHGATVVEFSAEEKAKWANTLPNIAERWAAPLEAKGLPAREVLRTYVDGLRKAGKSVETASGPLVEEMKKVLAPVEKDWIEKAKKKGVADPQKLLDELRAEVAAASRGK